jgi:hypothetical protein
MAPTDTKRQIRNAVEHADEPALSAKQIADRTGFAVKTVNKHIDRLTESGDLAVTQIGNATAYYSNRVRGGSHTDHSHQCRRCGRAVTQSKDMARVDLYEFFDDGSTASDHVFYLLCRFCKSDLAAWLFGDDGGDYPFVHRWNIPTEQLRDVQQDDTVVTTPGEFSLLDESLMDLYDIIRGREEISGDGWADKNTVLKTYAEQRGVDTDGCGLQEPIQLHPRLGEAVEELVSRGWVERSANGYRTARDASVDDHPEPRNQE